MSGTSDKIKGRVKEAVGVLTDDQRLKNEGKLDQTVGKIKQTVERAVDKAKDAVKKAARQIRIMKHARTLVSAAILLLVMAAPAIVVSLSVSGCYGPGYGTPYYSGGGGGYYGGGTYYSGGGDYDDHHQWHDADWWRNNNPSWARAHHPEWWREQPRERPPQREQRREQPKEEPPQREQKREQQSQRKNDSADGHGRGNQGDQHDSGHDHN